MRTLPAPVSARGLDGCPSAAQASMQHPRYPHARCVGRQPARICRPAAAGPRSMTRPSPRWCCRRLVHHRRPQPVVLRLRGRAAEGSSSSGAQPPAATSSGLYYERETYRDGASSSSASSQPAQERVGVLLLNLGGPDTLDDVQPFLYNLFADPDIIRLPTPIQFVQPAIAQLVAQLRTPKAREGYEAIGGGSPLRRITEEQAEALQQALEAKGLPSRVYVAMRYWKPFTGAGVQAG